MTNNFTNQSHTISAGKTVSYVSDEAKQIQIACGRVWLTIAGYDEDYWLAAGESMNLPAGRLIVIEADQQASLVELSGAAQRQTTAPTAGYFQKLTQRFNAALA
ncbi:MULTISPECIES: DUF2917 domain-containing protein [unclassified Undibacterium]|uniref:DUF2917 domain-containing protein n=1 Tax=unclassified Undibacterium TaxID=2630295 RepID=UPI002AC92119|nr:MULTISPECIES: DUF2917 domain-containing protein [unclassified Undibacterium]MEB0137468.1 DUF2917 domain-containing protein [Undibacterium sp. CCC2.1]MEB0170867.1 DUF2917 domain-containing protein [Undibacterium sp. CCC1.1]MEB0174819.1 DUF2917 domain-containing protein [Undibacterium sp. CCC3.4]MEB0214155.1 DUF2917 domain-containing protein [Undibacterium sp. 5I2]WPX44467.1 DUF2917 domain-containing protein [Undibacterium sp. CCC3.4]